MKTTWLLSSKLYSNSLKKMEIIDMIKDFGRRTTILAATTSNNGIFATDVFEHIPNCHVNINLVNDKINTGRDIIDTALFEPATNELMIHIFHRIPFEEAMVGMNKVSPSIGR